MSATPGPALCVLRFEEIEWDRPLEAADPGLRPPEALVRAAEQQGARRKRLVRGEGGFHMNRSRLPPGFRIPPHSHDHDELLVVIRGGCRIDGEGTELRADDAVVIRAQHRYGFTCGPEGMDFLTIRTGEARVRMEE